MNKDDIVFWRELVDLLKFLILPILVIVILGALVSFELIDILVGSLLGYFVITGLFIWYYLRTKQKRRKRNQRSSNSSKSRYL